MKILCAYSSIEFSCEHFPASLFSRESFHPIFNIPQKKLLSFLGKWAGNELTSTDSYLLFLSLLKSTDLVEFRVPTIRTEKTDSIVALNMEHLVKVVIRLNTVTHPAAVFPRYVVSQDTKTLDNVHYWIQNWRDAYNNFLSGYKSAHDSSKLITREAALERLIKNPHRPVSSYASQIADWASVAGEFPAFKISDPFNKDKQISCTDYWKRIIVRCANEASIFSIRRRDLEELLEHCEEYIPIGSIYSNALFKILRGALERHKNFLGLGDFDLSKPYKFVDSSNAGAGDGNTTQETEILKSILSDVSEFEPKPADYPNKLSYLKAKLAWDMSRKNKPINDVDGEGE